MMNDVNASTRAGTLLGRPLAYLLFLLTWLLVAQTSGKEVEVDAEGNAQQQEELSGVSLELLEYIDNDVELAQYGYQLLAKKLEVLGKMKVDLQSGLKADEVAGSETFEELSSIQYQLMEFYEAASASDDDDDDDAAPVAKGPAGGAGGSGEGEEDPFYVNTFGENGTAAAAGCRGAAPAPGGAALARCSVAAYPANAPNEDRFAFLALGGHGPAAAAAAGKAWEGGYLAAVLDGHGNWYASEFAARRLLPHAAAELALANPDPGADPLRGLAAALRRAFARTERELIEKFSEARRLLGKQGDKVASGGSCAAVVAVLARALVVANAGDCRVVLGRRHRVPARRGEAPRLVHEAVPLSADHNAMDPHEQARLRAEHPLEPDVVLCRSPDSCYVKGRLQPTRGFGDAYVRYPGFNLNDFPVFTPPYTTHDPEIIIHGRDIRGDGGQDAFVILGSDGLWEFFSSQEAVSFVGDRLPARPAEGEGEGGIEEGAWAAAAGSLGDQLVEEALRRAAKEANMSAKALRRVSPGRGRRGLHDDVTAMVLVL